MVMSITPKQFLELLTKPEVVVVMTSNVSEVVYFRTVFLASERVRGDDPDLAEGLTLLAQLNLLSDDTLQRIRDRMNLLSA